MRLNMQPAERYRTWHTWFAWYPVYSWEDGHLYWLERVSRCYTVEGGQGSWNYEGIDP